MLADYNIRHGTTLNVTLAAGTARNQSGQAAMVAPAGVAATGSHTGSDAPGPCPPWHCQAGRPGPGAEV
eukprot:2096727-Rhodomonas_salina.1